MKIICNHCHGSGHSDHEADSYCHHCEGAGFINIVSVTIGQFADRDPKQGEAIDHSIATGEGLFAERYDTI